MLELISKSVSHEEAVMPAGAGIQKILENLDSRSPIKDFEDRLRGNDEERLF